MGSKPFLSPNQQVERLKNEKGVKFEICSESQAVEYLQNNNNYFRLGAYRKNYIKNDKGNNAGKYNNLDFAYLVDLAIIDLELRDVLMRMTLDVEHYTKLQLLRMIEQRYNDGCGIFISYYNSLSEKEQDRLKNDLFETQKSKYCEEIIKKYFTKNFPDDFSIWAFFEVISFGSFLRFYKFCENHFANDKLPLDIKILRDVKNLRNAAAHNSCIINNLDVKDEYNVAREVTNMLSRMGYESQESRRRKVRNERVRHIVSLLYAHNNIVTSAGVKEHTSRELKKLVDRIDKNKNYYVKNDKLREFFGFFKKMVDILF